MLGSNLLIKLSSDPTKKDPRGVQAGELIFTILPDSLRRCSSIRREVSGGVHSRRIQIELSYLQIYCPTCGRYVDLPPILAMRRLRTAVELQSARVGTSVWCDHCQALFVYQRAVEVRPRILPIPPPHASLASAPQPQVSTGRRLSNQRNQPSE